MPSSRGSTGPASSTAQPAPSYQTDAERPGSTTETFVAIKAEVQNWRWAGVPFYLRTGKRMERRVSEIVIQFKDVPHPMFPGSEGTSEPNRLVIQLQPDEGMKLHMTAKEPGPGGIRLRPVSLDLSYAQTFQRHSPDAYERLLMDVVRGNPTLFMRRDEVEAAWTWVEPILERWSRPDHATPPLPRRHQRPQRRHHPSRARQPLLARMRPPMTTPEQPSNPVVAEVTARIIERSRPERTAYLQRLDAAAERGPARGRLACANLAHGFAASGPVDKKALRGTVKPNVAIVSAYNDMLSAHQPFESFPAQLKKAVIRSGGIAQFAGGVPAMCDGITQGRDGMQLSLFSRDVIAMSTAIALVARHVRRHADARRLRQDRARHADRRAVVRPPADDLRAGRADDLGAAERREGRDPAAVRRRRDRPRGAARGRVGVVPLGRHLHLLRHRELQPDADGGHGPAPARARASSTPARRCARRSPTPPPPGRPR